MRTTSRRARSDESRSGDLTFPDGRKMFLGSTGTGAPYELKFETPK